MVNVSEVMFSAQHYEAHAMHGSKIVLELQPRDNARYEHTGFHKEMRFTDFKVHGSEQFMIACRSIHEKIQEETSLAVNFVSILKACAKEKDLKRGSRIHTDIMRSELLERNVFVGSALVNMYAKCGALDRAREVFDLLPIRNVVAWNALISGYTQHELSTLALECFQQMQMDKISPTEVTFSSILKACANIGAINKGQEIHGQILKEGTLEKHVSAANALIAMYAKCGILEKAQQVFDSLLTRDEVSWNALITGYSQQGFDKEAIGLFEQMQLEGLSSNAVTFSCILKACGNVGAIDIGETIHNHIEREHLLGNDVVLGNALVDMYAKCGALEKARKAFDNLSSPNIVSWTVLISGYAQHGYGEEALKCFEEMQSKSLLHDMYVLSSILKACGSVGARQKGQQLHSHILRKPSMESQLVIGSALVDMYAKCSDLKNAHKVFDECRERNIALWNALMAGYSQMGKENIVLNLFQTMICEGIAPCSVSLLIVLNTCSHRGLLDAGEKYFEIISKDYNILLTIEHHTCIIDLLSRAGRFDSAITVAQEVPLCADLPLRLTLLEACQKWGNVDIAKWACQQS